MSGLEVAAAGAAIGTGVSLYGQISGAQRQAEAAKQDAALKNMQADELMGRQAINEQLMREQGDYAERAYGAAFASTGREGGGIGGIMAIHKNVLTNIENSRRDAEFKAKMLRAGASIETSLASDNLNAAYITGAGTILGSVAQGYSTFKGPQKAQGLWGN